MELVGNKKVSEEVLIKRLVCSELSPQEHLQDSVSQCNNWLSSPIFCVYLEGSLLVGFYLNFGFQVSWDFAGGNWEKRKESADEAGAWVLVKRLEAVHPISVISMFHVHRLVEIRGYKSVYPFTTNTFTWLSGTQFLPALKIIWKKKIICKLSLPRWLIDKKSTCSCRRCKRLDQARSLGLKDPWRRKWRPTSWFLPGKIWDHKESGLTECTHRILGSLSGSILFRKLLSVKPPLYLNKAVCNFPKKSRPIF